MFDALLKSKFYSKCKSAIKMTKTRIEIIRKKRNAMQKYLRNDIADLLKNGLDINAYGRAEGLLVELNKSSCYDLIEQFSCFISSHLAAMAKERECPEECREAVSSLMLAAARFADLPELRELRTLFTNRYDSKMDVYVNKEFAEKLKATLPSKDMKLQLMEDIAATSGLTWDPKALENKLYNSPAPIHDFTTESNGNGNNLHHGMNGSDQKKDYQDTENPMAKKTRNDEDRLPRKTENTHVILLQDFTTESNGNGNNLHHGMNGSDQKKDYQDTENPMAKKTRNDEDRLPRKTENTMPHKDNVVVTSAVKDIQVDTIGENDPPNQPSSYKSIPPPYTKGAISENENNPVGNAKPKPKPKPKPRSVRSRPAKIQSLRENVGNVGAHEDKDSVNEDKAAHGQRILKFLDKGNKGNHDQRDGEERMMDKLLFHYSRKKAANKDAPNRLSSLPVELASPTELTSPTKSVKKHVRTSSLQPEMLSSNGHVHPKLPDYDDFVARLAALRAS